MRVSWSQVFLTRPGPAHGKAADSKRVGGEGLKAGRGEILPEILMRSRRDLGAGAGSLLHVRMCVVCVVCVSVFRTQRINNFERGGGGASGLC